MTKRKPKQKFNVHTAIPKAHAPSTLNDDKILTTNTKELLEKYKHLNVIFSFQYFNRLDELFNCGDTESAWFLNLVDTLRSVSQMTYEEFRDFKHANSGLRVHSHDWNRAIKKYPLNEKFLKQIENDTIQFSLSRANGRVHGFTIDNLVHIVWLDPHHNMYPMERHGGLKYCDTPKDCYDCLLEENDMLKQEIKELKELMDLCDKENKELRTRINMQNTAS